MTRRSEGDQTDALRLYLKEVGRYPLLTKEDEVRLAQSIEAGRDAAATDLDGRRADTG